MVRSHDRSKAAFFPTSSSRFASTSPKSWIGVATRPVPGGFGWETTELGNLFTGPAKAWSIAGNLLQPIFNAGKNRSRVRIAESQQRQTLYGYERTVLTAFRDVEDGLVGYRKAGEQRVAQGERVNAERKVLELAELRYRGGPPQPARTGPPPLLAVFRPGAGVAAEAVVRAATGAVGG